MNLLHGIRRARQVARSIKNRWAGRVLILQYHRITVPESDPFLLCVTPQHFDEHLVILKKYGYPLRLREVGDGLRDKRLPNRAIVITFDDGYDDSLNAAKPLLERHDIPATVFVVTGQIAQKREFWWDELERLLLQPSSLPETLRLRVDESLYEWLVGDRINDRRDDFERASSWNLTRADNPSSRHGVLRSLYWLLHSSSKELQDCVLGRLLKWSGAEARVRPTHRTLSREEVIRLAAGGLVEIGAHSVTHPVLSVLPLADQQVEVTRSKTELEEILESPVESFSYPHGLKSHYTDETVTAVREAGFVSACSSFAGVVHRDTDRFQLPRLVVQDWNGHELERRIKQWLRQ